MTKRIVLLLAGSIMVGSLSAQHKTSPSANAKKSTQKKSSKAHYGTASFYANKFNGRKTANGDIFDQKKMTAACNILPLNTWVKVTNMHNKREVIVKITDRMHRDNKRLIDLSRGAANELGYTGRGLTRVRVEMLGKKEPAGWANNR